MYSLRHALMVATLLTILPLVCRADDFVRISLDSPTAVNRLLFGINCAWPMRNQPLDSPSLVAALKALHPGMLRFPGGTISSFWDVGAGSFVPDDAIRGFGFKRWAGQYTSASRVLRSAPGDRFSAKAFDRLCGVVGAEPCWTLNLATLSGKHEAESVRKMCAEGARLEYVEMGNEYDMGLFRNVLSSVDDYVEKSRPALQALRDCSRTGRVAYVASTVELGDTEKAEKARKRNDARIAGWASGLFKHRGLYDAWVVHFYGVGLSFVTSVPERDRPSAVLARPWLALGQRAAIVRARYGAVPVWLTEYNVAFHGLNREGVDTSTPAARFLAGMKNSGLHALSVAAHLLTVVENNDIYKAACYHSLAGMDGFGILRFDKDSPNSPAQANAAAQVLAHISAIAAESEEMSRVTMKNNPLLELPAVGGNLMALQAIGFRSDLKLTYVILNRSLRSACAKLDTLGRSVKGSAVVYTAEKDPKPLEWIELPCDAADKYPWAGPMKPTCSTVRIENGSAVMNVPPLSLIIVTLEK